MNIKIKVFNDKVNVYKNNIQFFEKTLEDNIEAIEYAGWLEALYNATIEYGNVKKVEIYV